MSVRDERYRVECDKLIAAARILADTDLDLIETGAIEGLGALLPLPQRSGLRDRGTAQMNLVLASVTAAEVLRACYRQAVTIQGDER